MKLLLKFLLFFTLATMVISQAILSVPADQPPNVIFILTDNQGAWSLVVMATVISAHQTLTDLLLKAFGLLVP